MNVGRHRLSSTDIFRMNHDPDEREAERDVSSISSAIDKSSLKTKPKNVSSRLWERFQTISRKTDEVTQRSTLRRIQKIQKSVLDTVHDQLKTAEEKEILQKHNVVLDSSLTQLEKGDVAQRETRENTDSTGKETDEQLDELNTYMGINDHLVKADSSRHYAKSGLEKQIDRAVASGNIVAAEGLSDQLAARDYGVKITEAFAAKEYLKRKKKEEDSIKAKKKKKLAWGFEHKQRWETKSNM